MREQELENTANKQKEVGIPVVVNKSVRKVPAFTGLRLPFQLESRIRTLSFEQTNIREQNRQLRSLNTQLQEQVESSRERLQSALRQLSLLQASAAQEQVARQRSAAKYTTLSLTKGVEVQV